MPSNPIEEILIAAVELLWLLSLLAGLANLFLLAVAGKSTAFKTVNAVVTTAYLLPTAALISGSPAPALVVTALPLAVIIHFVWLWCTCRHRSIMLAAIESPEPDFTGPPCVACSSPTPPGERFCPACGWTQPQAERAPCTS